MRDWLIDMAGRDPNLGWGRIDPESQLELFANDVSAYRTDAMVVGDDLRWRLEVGLTTWDGVYRVGLTLTEAASSVDGFADGRLIRRLASEGLPDRAIVVVRMLNPTGGAIVGD